MKHNYSRSIAYFVYLGWLLAFSSCEKFEFSPHQVILKESEENLNQKNADRIAALNIKPTDTLRFALISDTQRFYDETEEVVDAINNRTSGKGKQISFVIHAGDITDFGIQEEYHWQHEILKKLKMPYLVVIGNHDCVGNGKKIYQSMYGPHNFKLQVARNRFVFLNTNSLEFDNHTVPDLNFLENALSDTENYENAFVIAHVPPFDADYDRSKEQPYALLMRNYKVNLSIHGHQHTHRVQQPYNDGKTYLVTGSVQKRVYVVVTVIGNQVSYEVIKF